MYTHTHAHECTNTGGPKLAPLHAPPTLSDTANDTASQYGGAPTPSLITAECRVMARAEFPQLQVTDVLCDGKPKQVGACVYVCVYVWTSCLCACFV